ncbi:MAG: hypothetical protein JWN00_3594 [Actinomycetia bacterium]|nr:hypothetical protein [Actinomycetes bacterium]
MAPAVLTLGTGDLELRVARRLALFKTITPWRHIVVAPPFPGNTIRI